MFNIINLNCVNERLSFLLSANRFGFAKMNSERLHLSKRRIAKKTTMEYVVQLSFVRWMVQKLTGLLLPLSLLDFHSRLRSGVYLVELVRALSRNADLVVFDRWHYIYDYQDVQQEHFNNFQIFLSYIRKVRLPHVSWNLVVEHRYVSMNPCRFSIHE